jgi:hypothetical protein
VAVTRRRTTATGRLASAAVLAAVLVACGSGDDEVGGDPPDDAAATTEEADVAAPDDDATAGPEETEVTEEPAEDVEVTVTLERTLTGNDPALRMGVTVTNRRANDVVVVEPSLGSFDTADDGTITVLVTAQELARAPIGDAIDDAPPNLPGVRIASGDDHVLEVGTTAIPDDPPAVEVCLEVQDLPTGGTSGDEVPVTAFAPDGILALACGRADVPAER